MLQHQGTLSTVKPEVVATPLPRSSDARVNSSPTAYTYCLRWLRESYMYATACTGPRNTLWVHEIVKFLSQRLTDPLLSPKRSNPPSAHPHVGVAPCIGKVSENRMKWPYQCSFYIFMQSIFVKEIIKPTPLHSSGHRKNQRVCTIKLKTPIKV